MSKTKNRFIVYAFTAEIIIYFRRFNGFSSLNDKSGVFVNENICKYSQRYFSAASPFPATLLFLLL